MVRCRCCCAGTVCKDEQCDRGKPLCGNSPAATLFSAHRSSFEAGVLEAPAADAALCGQRIVTSARERCHLFGEFTRQINRTRDRNRSRSFDDWRIERTHGGAATPQQVLEESHRGNAQRRVVEVRTHLRVSCLQPAGPVCVDCRCLRVREGRCTHMTFSDWFEYVRTNWKKEEGQTMAEYGVVLAVITLGIVATLGLLAGGINGALTSVINKL